MLKLVYQMHMSTIERIGPGGGLAVAFQAAKVHGTLTI